MFMHEVRHLERYLMMQVRKSFSFLNISSKIIFAAASLFSSATLAADKSPTDFAKTATCVLSVSDNGVTNYAVFYLAGYGSDGSSYYRTISAPIYELTVKPDGSVGSGANPCKETPEFQR
jgi:hypothetical protein